MHISDRLNLSFGRKLPVILQNEAAECGLACLSMVASYHGFQIDMANLRRKHSVSMMGATLDDLIGVAEKMSLSTRAIKLELDELKELRTPCILHWNFNHFVVLKQVKTKSIVIHDPAVGLREISMEAASKAFTGVALELWPNEGFKPATIKQRVTLSQLMGKVSGLLPSLAQILMLAFVLEIFIIITPFYLQWTIDDVVVSADQDLLMTLAIAFVILVIFQQLIGLLRSWVMLYLSTSLSLQWRSNLFSHLLKLPIDYFETRHMGDVVSRFESVQVIQRSVTSDFIEAILDGVMSIIVLVVMFLYSVKLGSIALGVMITYGLIRWVWWRPLRLTTEEQIVYAAKQHTHFLETIRGIKPIKLFQRIDSRRETWLTLLVDEMNAGLRTQKLNLFYRYTNGLLFGVERVIIIALGALLVIENHFTVGALMAFLAYKDQFSGRTSTFIDRMFELRMLRLHGERLADIALTPPERSDATKTAEIKFPQAGETAITMTRVGYRYSDSSPWVLQNINLEIKAGESVAIVGPSGSGKSTLMHLILGLREAQQGEIILNGLSLKQLGLQNVLSFVSTVTQDDMLFSGSIAENIAFFDSKMDMERVEICAQLAHIHSDIIKMSMAYNTLIGDMGTVLSGGQRQRILLARALYRRPKMLILDEATSSLDIESEQHVNEAIQSLPLTRILIAHRPQTIMSADRAIVIRNGQVVADLPTDDFATIQRAIRGE